MVLLWTLLAFFGFCVLMFFRAWRKQVENKRSDALREVRPNAAIELNRDIRRDEAEEKEKIDIPASLVYSYITEVRQVMDSPVYHIREMNDVLEKLTTFHDEIAYLSANPRYKEFCARAIAMYVEDHEVRPTNKILGFISSTDKRLAFVNQLKSNFATAFIRYWDGVLNAYKQKPAKTNRIRYLINHITEFNDPKSLLGHEVAVALNGYKSRLENMLQ